MLVHNHKLIQLFNNELDTINYFVFLQIKKLNQLQKFITFD